MRHASHSIILRRLMPEETEPTTGASCAPFEKANYPQDLAEPIETLHSLMEDRGLRQHDLISAFGSSNVASTLLIKDR
jgi:antitoxin component HigA of HigAB toxin-antitoxin module